jgi:hypothetical protein
MIIKHDILKGKIVRYLTGLKKERTFKEFQQEFKFIHRIRIQPRYAAKLLMEIKKENKKLKTGLILLKSDKKYKLREGFKPECRI